MNFLKLIRWQNLAIICITMFLLRYCLLFPLLEAKSISSLLSHFHFVLLVLATVLFSAAGYIINDVYDVDTDKVNKPEKIIVGKYISVKLAENLNLVFNIIAIGIGIYLSFALNLRFISILGVLIAGMLYFYSTTYKGVLLMGNIIIAIFSALVPFIILIAELPLLYSKYHAFIIPSGFNFNFLIAWFGYYSLFAFLISLIREIIKDMEDFEGDTSYGKHTLPVKYRIVVSKIVVSSLITIFVAFILYVLFKYLYNPITIVYASILVIAPIIYTAWLVFRATDKKNYAKASFTCKLIMVIGLLYVVLANAFIL